MVSEKGMIGAYNYDVVCRCLVVVWLCYDLMFC